ncbi:uncharacterized protein LOC113492929 [Trichoplusia ni]|uniref:Uncharacterized protein LOC113492929 n=1 Tax=Trichoplusia ni TaxID=7111 RepID=A0A7E5VDW4_TRINI|nr:uncharacterized protein LOC113492929 [Trichoplusia ni]
MIKTGHTKLIITGVGKGNSVKMKSFIAFALLIVGISANAVPTSNVVTTDGRNFVSDAIIEAIEDVQQSIIDAGLDPLIVKKEVFTYALPVPTILSAAALVEEVYGFGLSNIVINHINYALLASRLDFDIELPLIHLSADKVIAEANLFNINAEGSLDGRIDLQSLRVKGVVNVNIGIISGISISNVDIDLTLGSIDTNIRLVIQGNNYSEQINKFISETIPEVLDEFKDDIDELLGIVIRDIVNDNL